MKPTLADAAESLEEAACVSLEWLEVIGKHGTLPCTRPELMKMLKRAIREYEKAEE